MLSNSPSSKYASNASGDIFVGFYTNHEIFDSAALDNYIFGSHYTFFLEILLDIFVWPMLNWVCFLKSE